MATKDPLIGREARVKQDATTLKGAPHPNAGMRAQIIGKTPGGRQYQLQCGDVLINLPMADFVLLDSIDTAPSDNTLPLSALVRSKTNRQILEDDALLEMAATMKLYGVLQPLLVRRLPAERLQETFEDEATRHATHEIIAGERRFVAARIAGLRQVPVLMKDADNTTAVVMQLIENLHREDLNPLDEAHGIQLLVEDFELTREAGPGDNAGKFADMFRRRAQRGQCVNQPYLGCREFSADVRWVEDVAAEPAALDETRDLGWMLYDLDFANPTEPAPRFFKATLQQGVVQVPAWNSPEVRG